ncbi:response regulator [Candidatus Viridilinea mediisalina]|uniref:Circadian input-output histidine kinase CikA n=1 Tax=Candidatus Viridilinea mediisalina TaxID=2024553 RepID=A0A2A6RJL6_9CHLR|nr:response regulator [Candidatus Viridilinea mediisalina]PDW03202.1 hypothetical protein CJ255_10100 [Candidatus Viridilinea mediisalina]
MHKQRDHAEQPEEQRAPKRSFRRPKQWQRTRRRLRHLEALLRLEHGSYANPLAHLDNLIGTVSTDGYILYLNELAAEHLGGTVPTLVGKHLRDILIEPIALQTLNMLRAIMEGQSPRIFELQVRNHNHDAHWYRVSFQPVHDRYGQVRYFVGCATDIHDLKMAQQELLELNQTLEDRVAERTAEYEDLYNRSPSGYHSLDPEGRLVMINQTELDWLGYTRDELLGQPYTTLLTAESRAKFSQQFPRFKERGWIKDLDLELCRKDGSNFPVLLSATALYDHNGDFVMSRSTIFDNSERKQVEQALLLANAEMERTLRTRDEFLATMSHELRTPLNAVLALSESLLEQIHGPLTLGQKASLRQIEQSGRHLLDLINDILDLSKIEASRLDLSLEPVAVVDACRSSLQFVREIAHKKKIQITCELKDETMQCSADPRRLKQMLVNLLSNAVKFTPSGGKVSLSVEVWPEQGLINFVVRDNGVGIKAVDLPRLFQPFTQLDSSLSRQHEGSGLGLVLVRRLAELHYGSIAVESSPGVGSCFTITLPYHPTLPQNATAPPTPVPQPLLPRSVLIVDDSVSTVEQLTRYLQELRIPTIVHAQAKQAVEVAHYMLPDLILLDLLMPECSGWEIVQQLREHATTRSIPVMITSVVDEHNSGLQQSVAGYLVKPITREQLRNALHKLQITTEVVHAYPEPPAATQAKEFRLLIAEDNQVNLEVMRDYLERKGFIVISASNGREALAEVERTQPDLILMDIQMPELDGLSAIRKLRSTPASAKTPIIALTALAMPGDRERCLAAGATAYLTKPMSLKDLVLHINRLLMI